MKQSMPLLLIFYFLFLAIACPAQAPKYNRKNLVGAFDGRSPCQELAKQLQEPTVPECIKIKWRLILYKDSVSDGPGTFILWGYIYKNESAATGKWHILKGTKANPNATVYQVDLPGKDPLFFQRGDENILFFLDKEKNLMVGNRDFGYTLNRID